MAKFSDLLPGILSGFSDTITKNLEAERDQEIKLRNITATARAKRQAAAEFPTVEEQLLQKFMGGRVGTPGRRNGVGGPGILQGKGVSTVAPAIDIGTVPEPDAQGVLQGLDDQGMGGFDVTGLKIGPFTLEKPELTGAQKITISEIKALKNGIVELRSLAANVSKGPIQGRFTGAVARITGGGGFAPTGVSPREAADADIYQRIKPGFARGIYRAVTGDKRISDLDAAQAALPFIPDLSQATEAFDQQFAIVERALLNRERFIEAFAQRGVEPPLLSAPEFVQLMRSAEREIKGTPDPTGDADAAFLKKLQSQFPGSSIRQVR